MTTGWIIIRIALGVLVTVIVAGPAVFSPLVLYRRDMTEARASDTQRSPGADELAKAA